MKICIPHRPIHIAAFLLLAFLCYQGHQWTRHLVGAALCGGFGAMTFTVAASRQPCTFPLVLTLVGPLFTYGLAYLGIWLLRSPGQALFGYGLIFASFTPLRWIQTLTGCGDELMLARLLTSTPSRLLVAALVFLIGIPPMLAAWRHIANAPRLRIFLGSYLLPLVVLFILLFGNRFLYGESGTDIHGLTLLGIPPLVLVVDLLALVLFPILWRSAR